MSLTEQYWAPEKVAGTPNTIPTPVDRIVRILAIDKILDEILTTNDQLLAEKFRVEIGYERSTDQYKQLIEGCPSITENKRRKLRHLIGAVGAGSALTEDVRDNPSKPAGVNIYAREGFHETDDMFREVLGTYDNLLNLFKPGLAKREDQLSFEDKFVKVNWENAEQYRHFTVASPEYLGDVDGAFRVHAWYTFSPDNKLSMVHYEASALIPEPEALRDALSI